MIEMSTRQPEDERTLVERAKGDPDAFGVLFERYHGPIFGYVLRRVRIWEVARDLTSETFLKALSGLWRYRWMNVPFSAWLYRIATNEIGMYFRRGRVVLESLDRMMEGRGLDPVDPASLETERLEAERRLASNSEFAAVQAGLVLLPVKYQEVIALRYFERKSLKEIATILGKKEGTVKSLLSRGIGKLRDVL
jgi:RNA polymerase sigma-70 factor (ECF subfamily)